MKFDGSIFLGILFGAILGVFYAAELAQYFPLLIIAAVIYLLGYFVHAGK